MHFPRLSLASAALLLVAMRAAAQTPPAAAPKAGLTGVLDLVRYDMPIGLSDGYAPTRQLAVRKLDGPDAVDWPELTLRGRPIFRDRAEETVSLQLHKGSDAASSFQVRTDDVIQPGNHWFRAMDWRLGRRHIYTADKTARTANSEESQSGRYELWTFPVRISGEGAPVVKNVVLESDGAVIYKKDGPWRSLTLLLPAGTYQLSVAGRPPVSLTTGLLPVKLGTPQNKQIATDVNLGGDGPRIQVQAPVAPEDFPNRKAWEADLAALGKPATMGKAAARPAGMKRYLGIEAPVSPMFIYAAELPHGRSGGFYQQGAAGFSGSYEQYSAMLADLGFDAVFDQANALPPPGEGGSFENRAAALAQHGLKLGLQYDNNWGRPSFQHPNLAFFSHTLPDWHGPLYRSLSLAAQRFGRLPNFLGFSIGADNAGYVSHWHWAPPVPDRPWGEGMTEFMGTPQPAVPRAPSLGPSEFPFEYPARNMAEFLKYVGRFDAVFHQYGYFAEAVRDVNPMLVFTTGSFGSSPGTGARGGWPWASIPGRDIFEGLNVQQAYDWNETHAALPMHNEALADRLRSYWPEKRLWALLDNDKYLYGREAWQRACVLALTRGISGLGTNFLPHPSGPAARTDVAADEKEMNAWIHRYGGVYARSEPQPVIGIFFGQHQAVQRRVVTGANPPEDAVYEGSHEGKVNEALFFCHAAGFPARVITYQEMMRGPLPETMKAILLVGLGKADESWNWAPGLERPLQQFVDHGGRIIADAESFCPVDCTRTSMHVAAYQPEGNLDPTPLLLERNRPNIAALSTAMWGLPAPWASSLDPTVWVIPTVCGDTRYVTVVNQAFAEGDEAAEMIRPADPKASKPEVWKTKGNASLYVKPQVASIQWDARRPIYDVRSCRKVTPEEAEKVDLTKDAFQWYALPPGEVTAPVVTVTKDFAGYYQVMVTVGGAEPMSGIPVKIDVMRGDETATLYGASGFAIRLPVHERDLPDEYAVTATELLSGSTGAAKIRAAAQAEPVAELSGSVRFHDGSAITKFANRKHVALTIALTPEQEGDLRIAGQARALEQFYRKCGRVVSLGEVKPGGVVESLQPLRSPNRYPQWKTIPSDLLLFGTSVDNVLILDQERAQIFPLDLPAASAGCVDITYTRSPFVGEYDVVNIVAGDAAGMDAAVKTIVAANESR